MKLLVIPLNPLSAIRAAGLGAAYMTRYFNPGGVADEVRVLDVHGEGKLDWPGFAHALLPLQPCPELSAWIGAAGQLVGAEHLKPGELKYGFPGLPAHWIDAVRAFSPDLIRGYGAGWCGFVATELGRTIKVPAIVSAHDLRGVANEAVSGASAVIAVSEAVATVCVRAGAPPQQVVTIPDRVNRELFSPQGALPQASPKGSPRLLCIARDSQEKNVDRLLAACEAAKRQHPGLVLVHVGKSTRDWSRWPFVEHHDSIPNEQLPAWYRWADWLLLPSTHEGFGIVLAEALSCGTPCITSNRAPMNVIVRDGATGLTCNPESVDSIAETLERALGEPKLRERLAANTRTSTEPYDIAKVESREASLYSWLCTTQKPLISVVLPTYKRERLIERAIGVVLSQDYPNFELIVVNDGSPDGTQVVLERVALERKDPRLKVIHAPHGGLPRALNVGFEQAKGELLTWTSDDCAFRPGALSAMQRELALDGTAGLVFANYVVVDEQGRFIRDETKGPVDDLPRRNVIGCCFLYRRALAEKVGDYDPEVELAEDYDYWLRCARYGRLIHHDRLLCEYGDYSDSLTRTRGDEVGEVAARVLERQAQNPHWKSALRDHLAALAGEQKTRGLAWRSLKTAALLIARYPLSHAGYWAAVRALTPTPLLRFSRKLRGAGK